MVGTRKDYLEYAVQAARAVLLELAHLFRSYGDDIVVVGWMSMIECPEQVWDDPILGRIDSNGSEDLPGWAGMTELISIVNLKR